MHGDNHGKGKVAILGTMAALLVSAALFCGLPAHGSGLRAPASAPPLKMSSQGVQLEQSYGRLPLYFIENRGQAEPQVKFYERGSGRTVWFTEEAVWFSLRRLKDGQKAQAQARRPKARQGLPERLHLTPPPSLGGQYRLIREISALVGRLLNPLPAVIPRESPEALRPQEPEGETVAIRQTPVGIRKGVKVRGLDRTEHRVNYFIGSDPKKWRTDIPTYAGVVYEEAYRGIDLKFYGQGRCLEYDIVVRPGADPSQVRFHYAGVERLEVTPAGHLALHLPGGGALLQQKPLVYQEVAGVQVAREGSFRIHRDTAQPVLGFEVAAYDRSLPLIIDPVLVFSTYLGGSGDDLGLGIALDGAGNVYLTGITNSSSNFPLQNPLQPIYGGAPPGEFGDAFVTKINSQGNALVFSTFLGGTDLDGGEGVAVDGLGNVYVTGQTYSDNFPRVNSFQPSIAGEGDAFVCKIAPQGNALIYSTFLGGSKIDDGRAIAVDDNGQAYVAGHTYSSDFPTRFSLQPFNQGVAGSFTDAFVAVLEAGGSSLAYSTFLGGSNYDHARGIAISRQSKNLFSAYLTGYTGSADFPTQAPLQADKRGRLDAFVAKIGWTFRYPAYVPSLSYSTYLGGDNDEIGNAIAVDGSGNAYLVGVTESGNFPTVNPLQPSFGGMADAFVAKLNAQGSALAYSTYLGGEYDEEGLGIAVDGKGNAVVTGCTYSSNFPLRNALQPIHGGGWRDAFVTKITPQGSAMIYSTYLGGSEDDTGNGVVVDGSGYAYLMGNTKSGNFPLQKALQPGFGGVRDTFVAKIAPWINITPSLEFLLFD